MSDVQRNKYLRRVKDSTNVLGVEVGVVEAVAAMKDKCEK